MLLLSYLSHVTASPIKPNVHAYLNHTKIFSHNVIPTAGGIDLISSVITMYHSCTTGWACVRHAA